jgi:tetratricopeptide (TPR) repeat protein
MRRSRSNAAVTALAILAVCAGGAALSGRDAAGQTSPPAAAGVREAFAKGNSLYEAGDYGGAVEEYSRAVKAGVADKDLYYNLANAYYKLDDFGRAVLYYERALRLAPRDADARANLELVRSQLRDKQFVRERNRVVRTVAWVDDHLNAREMTLVASICYIVLCVLGIVFVLRDSRYVSAAYRAVSYVSPGRLAGFTKTQDLLAALAVVSLLFASTGIAAHRKSAQERERKSAVIVEEEVAVYSGPAGETTLQFKVHEGTLVRVREARSTWVRINLPGGLSGWVAASAIERV